MRIDKLILDNFKNFRDRTEILLGDPDPTDKKNVILVGGQNGAGKTSLLEAVNLCLYGGTSDFILERINRANLAKGRATLELGLDLTLDNGSQLQVRRSWTLQDPRSKDPRGLRPDFRVMLGGQVIMSAASAADWNEFIEFIIPRGVSQFFFFDGEKIQELAADVDPGGELKASMESVLGIGMYRTLAEDLESLVSRIRKGAAGSGASTVTAAQAQVQGAAEEIEDLQAEHKRLEDDLAEWAGKREQLDSEIKRTFGAGSDFLAQRNELIKQQANLEAELASISEAIHTAAQDELPFAPVTGLLTELGERLRVERSLRDWQNAAKAGREHVRALVDAMLSPHTPCCEQVPSEETTKTFTRRLADAMEREALRPPDGSPQEVLFDLSAADTALLESQIGKLLATTAGELRLRLERRSKTQIALRETQSKLERMAMSEGLERQHSQLMQDYANANQHSGRKRQELRDLESRLEVATAKFATAKGELNQAESKLVLARQEQRKVDLAERARKAVLAFVDSMRLSRAAQLESKCLEMYRRLSTKGERVQAIKIDPETYHVTLRTADGQELPKRELSAGEKEIYAISLLWGLAQTAQRQIPIIIDTPLARLDSKHRDSIIRSYLPTAGHQIIVLSTDTEVDQEYYAELEPFVARAMQLQYDQRTETTTVTPGYFWRNNG